MARSKYTYRGMRRMIEKLEARAANPNVRKKKVPQVLREYYKDLENMKKGME